MRQYIGTVLQQCLAHTPSLATGKDFLSAVQSLATVIALIAAGWWFHAQRQTAPKVKIEQLLSQRGDARDPTMTLVGIEIRVTNIGNVALHLRGGKLGVDDVNPGLERKENGPPEAREVYAADIHEIDLEPGEFDQPYFTRFSVSKAIRTLQISTAYPVPGEPGEFWSYRALFDIGNESPKSAAAVFTSAQTALPSQTR